MCFSAPGEESLAASCTVRAEKLYYFSAEEQSHNAVRLIRIGLEGENKDLHLDFKVKVFDETIYRSLIGQYSVF